MGVDRPLDKKPRYPLEFDRTPLLRGETEEIDISGDAAVVGHDA
jgi:hypothetical protein